MHATAITILLLGSALAYFLIPAESRGRYTLLAFAGFLLSHHGLSWINAQWFLLPGADVDAHNFHDYALRAVIEGKAPAFSIGTGIYEDILYLLYKYFVAGKFLGQSLSVLFGALYCVIALRLLNFFSHRASPALTIWLLALTPSLFFFSSITVREVFQVFGLSLACLTYSFALTSRDARWFLAVIPSLVFAGVFHHVILALAVAILAGMVVVYIFTNGRGFFRSLILITTSCFVVAGAGALLVMYFPADPGNDYVGMLRHAGGIPEMISRYREAVDSSSPRTAYGFHIDFSTNWSFVAGLMKSYVYYLFGPWLGNVEQLVDLVPSFNALIRALGLISFFYLAFKRQLNLQAWVLFAIFVSVSFLWSIGTTNYGQAFRHHAMTDWIAVLWIPAAIAAVRSRRS